MIPKLAWRNIWRNKRRSVIVLISIVIGVTAIVVTDSLTKGILVQSLENQIGQHTAHIQIHKTGYLNSRVIENFMYNPPLKDSLSYLDSDIRNISYRTIVYGLVSSATNSTGSSIIGIRPEDEKRVTTISKSVIDGNYLTEKGHEAVISKKLSEILGVNIGDKIVVMASSVDGTIGSDMFRVVGLYKTVSSSFDRAHVYIHIKDAAAMLHTNAGVAEIALIINNVDSAGTERDKIQKYLGSSYDVDTYIDILPGMMAQLDMAENSMLIFYFIIGLAMVFGIINMMLMSIFERINEFGVLKAIGMKNSTLFNLILLESFFLGLLGTIIGSFFGVGVNLFWMKTGLDFSYFSEGLAEFGMGAVVYPVFDFWGIIQAAVVILTISIIAAIYPAYRALKLEPINAIRYI